jgi:hypothetical protein
MCNVMTPTMTVTPGIVVPVARLRLSHGAFPEVFPGVGAPTRWSEMTGFNVRHQFHQY